MGSVPGSHLLKLRLEEFWRKSTSASRLLEACSSFICPGPPAYRGPAASPTGHRSWCFIGRPTSHMWQLSRGPKCFVCFNEQCFQFCRSLLRCSRSVHNIATCFLTLGIFRALRSRSRAGIGCQSKSNKDGNCLWRETICRLLFWPFIISYIALYVSSTAALDFFRYSYNSSVW